MFLHLCPSCLTVKFLISSLWKGSYAFWHMFIYSILKMEKTQQSIEVCMLFSVYWFIWGYLISLKKDLSHNWVWRQTRTQVETVFKHSSHLRLNFISYFCWSLLRISGVCMLLNWCRLLMSCKIKTLFLLHFLLTITY